MASVEEILDAFLQGIREAKAGEGEARAEATVEKLAKKGQPAFEALAGLFKSDDIEQRWWVTRALAEFENAEANELLLEALQDPAPAVQHCAAVALRKRPDSQAIPQLCEALEGKDRLLARVAGDALEAVGREAVPALLTVLEEGEQGARLEAVRALAAIGDEQAAGALFKLLDEDSALMSYWAEKGLEKMGIGMQFFKPG